MLSFEWWAYTAEGLSPSPSFQGLGVCGGSAFSSVRGVQWQLHMGSLTPRR
jgi:hypothetical protein